MFGSEADCQRENIIRFLIGEVIQPVVEGLCGRLCPGIAHGVGFRIQPIQAVQDLLSAVVIDSERVIFDVLNPLLEVISHVRFFTVL